MSRERQAGEGRGSETEVGMLSSSDRNYLETRRPVEYTADCEYRMTRNVSRTTIVDAVVQALPRDGSPRSSKEVHQIIVDKSLFAFRAKDPVGMVRSALRKHLAAHGGQGQPPARVRQVERDRYVLA